MKVNDGRGAGTARKLFDWAFGDTVVARNFDEGHTVALEGQERHRVVTREGALFEKSGRFTKGGGSKWQHTFLVAEKKQISQSEIKKAEKAAKNAEERFHEANGRLNTAQREIYRLRERMPAEGAEMKLLTEANGFAA